jgi:hypothetical protein
MNHELARIIELYQSAVAELFPRLAKHLGTQLPITNNEWAIKPYAQRGTTCCGIQYYVAEFNISFMDMELL